MESLDIEVSNIQCLNWYILRNNSKGSSMWLRCKSYIRSEVTLYSV